MSRQADIDDITLSQVCDEMEKEKVVFKGFYKLTLSLTMYAYGYSPHTRSLDHMVLSSHEQTDFVSGMVLYLS